MNEKDRILDLVRQNIISMDEALELLEAAGKAEATEAFKTTQSSEMSQTQTSVVNDDDEAADFMESANGLSAKLDQLNVQKGEIEQQLTVVQQRLREIEVFEELEELTPEMQEQKVAYEEQLVDLTAKNVDLEEKIETVTLELKGYRKDQFNNYTQDIKRFVSQAKDQVTEKASQFSQEAGKEGNKFSTAVTGLVKDFAKNFNTRDIQVGGVNKSIKMPWVKENKFQHTFNFPVDQLEMVDLSILNGSLEIEAYDGQQVIVESEITLFGAHEREGLAAFEALSLVEVEDGRFMMQVKSPRVAIDAKIKLPTGELHYLKAEAFNGNQSYKGIQAKDVYVNAKNGDVKMVDSQLTFLNLTMVNGETYLADNQIQDITYNNVNGDLRVKGEINNLIADSINSNFYITKTNEADSRIKVKTVRGTIKLAVPETSNLEANMTYHFGELHHRLENLQVESITKDGARLERAVTENQSQVLLNIEATNGTIYLKDNSK